MIETRQSHSSLLTCSHSLLFPLLATMYVTGGAIPHPALAPLPLPQSSRTINDVDLAIFVKATAIVCAVIFVTVFSIYLNYWTAMMFAGGHDGVRWWCSCSGGIDREVLDTFPILVYSTIKNHKIGKGELECAVCLIEFEDHKTLRLIPKRNHVFHAECIDAWLASHVTYTLCRSNLKPDSGEAAIRMRSQLNVNKFNEESEGNYVNFDTFFNEQSDTRTHATFMREKSLKFTSSRATVKMLKV